MVTIQTVLYIGIVIRGLYAITEMISVTVYTSNSLNSVSSKNMLYIV